MMGDARTGNENAPIRSQCIQSVEKREKGIRPRTCAHVGEDSPGHVQRGVLVVAPHGLHHILRPTHDHWQHEPTAGGSQYLHGDRGRGLHPEGHAVAQIGALHIVQVLIAPLRALSGRAVSGV